MHSTNAATGQQRFHGIQRIVSGGQTGVDQAALDVAIELGIPHGGWCPLGRINEAGTIDAKYQLTELPVSDYAARTLRNVIDTDGTLILYNHRLQGGTALTCSLAKQHNKPIWRTRMDLTIDYAQLIQWLDQHQIRVLNVAGPRASSNQQLYAQARTILLKLFQRPPSLFS